MHLRSGEVTLRTIRRHRTPYVFHLLKVSSVSVLLFLLLFFVGRSFESDWMYAVYALVSFFIGIFIAIFSLDYLLDKLIITNKRIVWINWKSLFRKAEYEAELLDIQDIDTHEKGILSRIRAFDYGLLEIETAGSRTCIIYEDCPNPEGVKTYILNQMEKTRGGIHEKHTPRKLDDEWSVN